MLKKWTMGLLSILLIVSNFNISVASASDSEGTDSEWELVFSDEFDGTEINMDNWSFDHPENGRYNGEIQSYTDKNAWVEDGSLIIEAREEEFIEPDGKTYDYTSSKLITKGKQTWTYGKIEVRAKMPTGQGMWPAIWMMPEDEPFYGTWPVGGEIDIMELLGHEPDTIHGNIHYGDPKGESQGTYVLPNGQSFADDYHVYTLEWEPGEIRWYLDGELFNKANDWHSKHPNNADDFAYPAPFDQDFYLILNISVGGGWPGNPDGTTELPQQMAVDYVRVYQKNEYPVREKPEPSEEDSEGRAPLDDGNYVYNGNFNLNDPETVGIDGVANTDYWTYAQGPGGKAELKVENEELHVQIVSGGTVDYGVQLIQDPIHLEKGAKYRASFKAKAEKERDIKVKVGGGDSRGYSEYSGEDPIALSTEWDDYEFEFVMPERTDLKARFEFNMGLDDADVWLSDVRLEQVEDAPITDPSFEPRPPLSSGNYIYNGTFDQGAARMAFWEFKTDSSAEAEKYIGSAVSERRFETRINNGGDQAESIQLVQPEINLEQGNSYQLTFNASADATRNIEVSLISENGNLVSDQIVELNTETNKYTIDFDVDVATDNNVELQFNVGGSDDDVYLDNVELTRVLESDGIENNLIQNGIFDSLSHWTTELNHAQASFKVDDDGHFNVNITDVGDDTWTIQLYQEGINIEKDATYQLSFKARSTVDRPVSLNIEHSTDYTKYLEETVSLNDAWATYNYEFTMEEETDSNTKFGFSFGGDGTDNIPYDEHDILIDDVVLTKIEDIEEPGTEEPGTEEPGKEEPGTEEPGTEEPGTEEPGTEEPGTEDPGIEEPGTEEPGTEEPGIEEPGKLEVKEVNFGETTEVSSNQIIKVIDTLISVQLPNDLPVGTKMTISKADDANAAGDVVDINLELPEGYEDYEGKFILTLEVADGFIEQDVAIYYFNEATEEWEIVGGEIDKENQTISVTVNHFSKYGVFVINDESDKPAESKTKEPISDENKNGRELPKTATTMFNWLVIGFSVLLAGVGLALFTRRKSLK